MCDLANRLSDVALNRFIADPFSRPFLIHPARHDSQFDCLGTNQLHILLMKLCCCLLASSRSDVCFWRLQRPVFGPVAIFSLAPSLHTFPLASSSERDVLKNPT